MVENSSSCFLILSPVSGLPAPAVGVALVPPPTVLPSPAADCCCGTDCDEEEVDEDGTIPPPLAAPSSPAFG
uniref:Putative secreted peptide n=1 Tax=Anopheles braziliensis TaxID=58242 RepID=A0A2M3ZTS1_9DIPT